MSTERSYTQCGAIFHFIPMCIEYHKEEDQPIDFSDQQDTTEKYILIVESDPILAELLCLVLADERRYTCFVASNCLSALKFTAFLRPDLFILDTHLPDGDGTSFYCSVKMHVVSKQYMRIFSFFSNIFHIFACYPNSSTLVVSAYSGFFKKRTATMRIPMLCPLTTWSLYTTAREFIRNLTIRNVCVK